MSTASPVELDSSELSRLLAAIWITADHHFGHANIVAYAGRPFSAADQDREMAQRWRDTVPPSEPVLHLGDLVVGANSPDIWRLVASLTGEPKWLVRGNHDRPHRLGLIRDAGFTIVSPPELQYGDRLVRFTHRPLAPEELAPGQVNVHGHTHSRPASADPRWINVSVEATDYRPVRLGELLGSRIPTH